MTKEEIYSDFKEGRIHKSLLQSYIWCKAKVRFLELSSEEPEIYGVEPDEISQRAMTKGSFFHEFSNYWNQVTNNIEFQKMLFKWHKSKTLNPINTYKIKEIFLEHAIPEEEKRDVDSPFAVYYDMIDAFLETEAKRLTNMYKIPRFKLKMLLWKPLASEIKFRKDIVVDMPNAFIEAHGIGSMRFKVAGTIDRINRYKITTGGMNLIGEVMEYKTGNWRSNRSTSKTNVRRELAFYAVSATPYDNKWDLQRIACYNPEAPEALSGLSEKLGTRTANSMLTRLGLLQFAIEDDDFDQPECNPYICMYCDYLDKHCPKRYPEQWKEAEKHGGVQEARYKRQNERK